MNLLVAKSFRDNHAPIDDPKEQARRIAHWSLELFGDKMNRAHYWVRNKIPKVHLDIYEHLSNELAYYYITAPRGYAKSTVVQLIYVLYRTYYQLDPYIVLIEKIDKSGIKVLHNIKREIRQNPRLLRYYGNIKPEKSRESDKQWAQQEIRLENGVFIRSIGMMGDIRGSLDEMYRITLVLGNDVQSIKHMSEPATLEKHIDYWDRDVEPAIDHVYGKVRLVGNMLGPGCLLEYITKNPEYSGINFSALVNDKGEPDLNGKSIWEDRFPTAVMHKKRDAAKAKGRLSVFWAEWMNIIKDDTRRNLKGWKYHDCTIKQNYGQNVLISDMYDRPIPVYTYACLDPAFGKADNSDARALVTIALGQFPDRAYNGKIVMVNGLWVLDYDYNHADPTGLIDRALDLHVKYYYRGIIIEANGPQQIFEYIGDKALLTNEFAFKNPVDFIPVRHVTGKKEDRIFEALGVKCKLGQFFIHPDMEELENEMEQFLLCSQGLHITDAIAMGTRFADVCMDDLRTYEVETRAYREKKERDKYGSGLDLRSPLTVFRSN